MEKPSNCLNLTIVGYALGGLHLTGTLTLSLIRISQFTRKDSILALILFMIIMVFNFVVSALLVLGIRRKRLALLLPWMVTVFVYIIYLILAAFRVTS